MTRRACVALLLLGCGASAPGAEASGMDASAAEPGAAPGRDLGGDAMADAGGDAGRDLGVEGPDAGADRCARAGEGATCTLPAYPRRPYRVWVPSGPSDALPVVLALHGGGGSAESTERTTCAGGDLRSPSCLHALGQREGFATVYPNGTENTDEAGRFRVWNAGGSDPYMCVAGRACTENVDDVAYLEAVLDALAAELPVDPARVYATGLSNGGAMAHRLACELAERVVAIAPIGAGNQLATSAPCTPAEPVAVMHVHGTADPCWRYRGGPVGGCIGDPAGLVVSVAVSMLGWAERLGCAPEPVLLPGPERADDGIDVVASVYRECAAPLTLLSVRGGGHTWVNGHQYFPARLIGPTFADVTNEDLWAFFDAVRR